MEEEWFKVLSNIKKSRCNSKKYLSFSFLNDRMLTNGFGGGKYV